MSQWILRFALSGAALYLTSVVLNQCFPHDLAHMTLSPHLELAALAIFCLGLVNSLVRPVVGFFGKPLSFMTLGLSSLVINAALFWVVGDVTRGYDLGGIAGLALAPILMGFINGALSFFIKDRRDDRRHDDRRHDDRRHDDRRHDDRRHDDRRYD